VSRESMICPMGFAHWPVSETNKGTKRSMCSAMSDIVIPTAQKRHRIEGPCYLKMLVDEMVAGCIIGRRGTIINSIENETGCQMKLSPGGVYFPGTAERVVIISGKQEEINAAMFVILDKIRSVAAENDPQVGQNQSVSLVCKIVVPKSCVSAIIGKEGNQIKQLQETSGARIQITNREEGLGERLVLISGPLTAVQNAAQSIAASIQADPNLRNHTYVEYDPNISMSDHGSAPGLFTSMTGSPSPYGAYNPFGINPMNPQYHNTVSPRTMEVMQCECEISIAVPDTLVGSIIGKSGRSINEMFEHSGARIRVSKKGDLIEGTEDRKVSIIGSVAAVHKGHILLLERLQELKNFQGTPRGTATVQSRSPLGPNPPGFMPPGGPQLYGLPRAPVYHAGQAAAASQHYQMSYPYRTANHAFANFP